MHNDGQLFVKNTEFQDPKTQRKIDKKDTKSLHQRFFNSKNNDEINRN